MPQSIRSFLCFDIENETVLNRLETTQRRLVQTGADMKLVKTQNIHITIRFIGNTIPAMIEKIFEEMKKILFTPFTVHIKGLGTFPNLRYPRVVWAGIAEGAEQLRSVFNQIEPKLRDLGFTPDLRGFSPHLSIARVRSSRNKAELAEFVKNNSNWEFGSIEARCLRLKKSILTLKGPIYSTLKEFCPQL